MTNIGLKESLTIEFKSDKKQIDDNEVIDAVVAFANTGGGTLYVGIEDNGDITGLSNARKDITRLAALIANKTIPPVSVIAEIVVYGGVSVAQVEVPKRTSIIASSSGRVLRRRLKADGTPENVPLYPYEIPSRLSSLRQLDYSAQPVPESTYTDLDPVERERLRNIIRTYPNGERTLLELPDEELDKALQLVTSVGGIITPTFAGLLLIGKFDRIKDIMPTAESAIQVLQGRDIKVNESFTLPILAAFEKISEYMNAWNREEEIEQGLFRITIPDIDKRAFREALVNAYAHRDYSMLGRVRLQIDDLGLTITNPGGFIEGVSVDNLLTAEPHGRNPVLADALKRIGLAERTGRGIDRIFEGSLIYGKLLPNYGESNATMVRLFIPKSLPDIEFVKLISEEQNRTNRPLPIYALFVLNSLKTMYRAKPHDIAVDIKTDETKVKTTLESLAEAGIVEAVGTGRGRYYILGSRVYHKTDNAVGYVRQTGIDTLRFPELVLKLAERKGSVTRSDVIDLLRVNGPQAYRILKRLTDEGKLKMVGNKKHAKYIAV